VTETPHETPETDAMPAGSGASALLASQAPAPSRGYVAESFGAFFGDRSWFGRALVGMVVWNVPVIGPMAILGYALQWLSETAFGRGKTMPTKPKPGETLLLGLQGLAVQIVWTLLGLVPLFSGLLVGVGLYFSVLMPGSDRKIGAPVRPGSSSLIAEAFGVVVVSFGVLAFLAFVLLALVGISRLSIYRRVSAGMPLSGTTAFVVVHGRTLLRALGASALASIPTIALDVAISATPAQGLALTPLNITHWLLYLPYGFASFCTTMIWARAFGRWLRDADPSTFPEPGARVDREGHAEPRETASAEEAEGPEPPMARSDDDSEPPTAGAAGEETGESPSAEEAER